MYLATLSKGEGEGENRSVKQLIISRLASFSQGVFGEKVFLLVLVDGAERDMAVRPYLFETGSFPLTLTPVECSGPPDVCVNRFLTQHTAMLRVYASLPLYITSAKNRK